MRLLNNGSSISVKLLITANAMFPSAFLSQGTHLNNIVFSPGQLSRPCGLEFDLYV